MVPRKPQPHTPLSDHTSLSALNVTSLTHPSITQRHPLYATPITLSSAESAEAEAEDNRPESAHNSPALAHGSPSASAADCADIPCMFPAASDLPSGVHPVEVAATPGPASAAPERCVVSPSNAAEPSPALPPVASLSVASRHSPFSAEHSPPLFSPQSPHTHHRNPGS